MQMQNLIEIRLYVLRIVVQKEILTSIKNHNAVINLRKLTCDNHKQDPLNINTNANLVEIHHFGLKTLSD